MLKIIFFFSVATIILCDSVKIASQTWQFNEIKYTVIHNKHTPKFQPQFFIEDLVKKALSEYQLPGITLNISYNTTIYKGSLFKSVSMDGINSISFHPTYYPASTAFYQISNTDRAEFDMKFNSDAYKTAATLYIAMLHEFGHIFGLAHPDKRVDTIMGRGLLRKPNGEYIQEHTYFSLTKDDVISLYKHELKFRTFSWSKRIYINLYLWVLLSTYTTTLQEQELNIKN